MEIEALEAILMDEFKEIHPSESGLNTSSRCFQITISPEEDDFDNSMTTPVQLGLIFSHTEKYPDDPPLLNVISLKGIHTGDLKILKDRLEQEALENLGMAMVYTLFSTAKEWLAERFAQDDNDGIAEAEEKKDEIIVPHGEPVTVDTFLAWRERFEAELALERAKHVPEQGHLTYFSVIFFCKASDLEVKRLMPEIALTTTKEKKLTGRQWFESGRASMKGAAAITEDSEEDDDDDIDFDDEDFEDDEEDMLEHYLAEKSDSSAHSSKRAN
uniref:RWD domain-containing protein n=1 Tax=Daucus carota subsp. sativus TaxID=79200 RepID=A0A164USJ9_DAUCS